MASPKPLQINTKNHDSRAKRLKCWRHDIKRIVNTTGNQGFSVTYVLVATLILIAGTSTLLNQSTSSMLGSIFQGQSWQARNVARSGISYLISLLNKEDNRHLLVLKNSSTESASATGDALWTDAQARQYHLNPCKTSFNGVTRIPPTPPNLSELNLGNSRVNDGYFYISDNGVISKSRNGSRRAFRIVNRPNSIDFKLARNTDLSLLDDTLNKGSFRLSVEALVYRDGQSNEAVSRTILQEDFSVIPKCCKLPFGSHQDITSNGPKGHGNSSYALSRSALPTHRCMLPGFDPDGYGIVVGAGGAGGFINADGATIKNLRGVAVNPLYCLSANPMECTGADNSSGNQMERLDINLPPPPRYPGNWSDETSAPPLTRCLSAADCPSNASGASGTNQLMQYNSTSTPPQTIFNAAAITNATQLPSNCILHRNDIHCIYKGIDLSGSTNNIVFVSGNSTRRIRLYFPTAGNVITQSPTSGTLRHCKNAACSEFVGNTTDVSFFGAACPYDQAKPNECGKQDLTIKGSVSEARFFIFAPQATVKIVGTGTATFQGVIWAHGLDIRGTTAIPSIPKTGVADVFHLMGILPDENNTFSKSLFGHSSTSGIPPQDMVARRTNRYRFFGN